MSEYRSQQPVSRWASSSTTTLRIRVELHVRPRSSTWGWIHVLIGVLLILSGLSLFSGAAWAGVVAMTLAVLSAVSNFFFIPYYPFWSILEIALACWVIWAITRPGLFDE